MAAVLPNKAKELRTTHSWEFMHFEKNDVILPFSPWRKARFGRDVIVNIYYLLLNSYNSSH